MYIWLCVDRVRNKIVEFEVSDKRDFASYLKLAMSVKDKYKVEISCSDHYEVYNKYHIGEKHICSKAETSLVESFNSMIRHYLARFHRKTKRYSKKGLSDILCKLQKGKECNMLSGVELQNSKRGKHIIKFPITINSSMLLNNRFELTTYEVIL